MLFFRRKKNLIRAKEIDPDEILLDARNLPAFNVYQLEGRIPITISRRTGTTLFVVFCIIAGGFFWRLVDLQIARGAAFLEQSENNRLRQEIVFQRRGVIYDRNGTPLAWNVETATSTDVAASALRAYIAAPGFGHVLGYVSYPKKDAYGVYYQTETLGMSGVEKAYDTLLAGTRGLRIAEENALGETVSESVLVPPEHGSALYLSIDARVQEKLAHLIADLTADVGFQGGAAAILEVGTGDVLALVSLPEYNSALLSEGKDTETIAAYQADAQTPFLNRALAGLYTPGSIVKPFLALGALSEKVITPEKQIYSSGSISVPNPYDPSKKTVFNDWKAHGFVDMRRALAVSSNVYFFEIGGGFQDQRGLGISGIEKYARLFGIGMPTGIDIGGEIAGTIPNPEWKERMFPGDPWRIGDTYNTAIGQYGFQVTPLQMARAVAAIATRGLLPTPRLVADEEAGSAVRIPGVAGDFDVVAEGMRQGVAEGTAQGLSMAYVPVAAKTGTAEVGITKKRVNSWVIGFFPYEHPRYAFAAVMEGGPRENLVGATYVMRGLLEWMSIATPEYLE